MRYFQQIKYIQEMDKDKGLIGFLQKKPLFQTEIHKSARKKRSDTISSNDKSSIIQKITDRDLRASLSRQKYNPTLQNTKNSNLSNQQIYVDSDSRINLVNKAPQTKSRFPQSNNSTPFQLNKNIQSLYRTKQSTLKNSLNRNFQTPTGSKVTPKDPIPIKSPNNLVKNLNKSRQQREIGSSIQRDKPGKFWQSGLTRTNGFQSARSQSANCLQNLSFQLKIQLSNINNKIQKFRRDLFEYLQIQVQKLREKIFILVQQTFQQSNKHIAEYMQAEESRVAGDLLKLRESLQQYYVKIEKMKQDLNKPQWRKVAGEILSTELQNNIQGIINQSKGKEVVGWEKKHFGVEKVKNIAKQLKELIKLKQ